ncbi:MAG TPA: BON domain-containing protein [Burkholderiales bacterium]|jgi:osmotically-inducible protein OsmY|nr:BON domain-containing protein [Burkholderiales bacterium]
MTAKGRIALALLCGGALGACDRQHEVRAPDVEDHARARQVEAATQRVIGHPGEVLDDATVTAKVKTALIAEPGLRALEIDVNTRDNVVTLNGTASSQAIRDDAERIALETSGVKQVKNNLTIKARP